MRTSFSTALVAMSLLSDPISALRQKREIKCPLETSSTSSTVTSAPLQAETSTTPTTSISNAPRHLRFWGADIAPDPASPTTTSPPRPVQFWAAAPSPDPSASPAPSNAPVVSGVVSAVSTVVSGASSVVASAVPSGTSSPAAPAQSDGILRGANLGNLLILEPWMGTPDDTIITGAFGGAKDQLSFDNIAGALDALNGTNGKAGYWQNYIQEEDFEALKTAGINALRIPIGYWAYVDSSNSSSMNGQKYVQGAADIMDQLIIWARKNGLKVWIDLHGSAGSQNGQAHSGQTINDISQLAFQADNNQELTTQALVKIAERHATLANADVVVGVELTNEPCTDAQYPGSKCANKDAQLHSWAQDAFNQTRAASKNPNLEIVMHDAFMQPKAWVTEGTEFNKGTVQQWAIDTHMYQLYDDTSNAMDQDQHIQVVCNDWANQLKVGKAVMPTYVGEFSALTNICAYNNGTTIKMNGNSCNPQDPSSCVCISSDFSVWNDGLKKAVRMFLDVQIETFEAYASGYFIWSWKAGGGWGLKNLIADPEFSDVITTRKYPGQCSNATTPATRKRVAVRGSSDARADLS